MEHVADDMAGSFRCNRDPAFSFSFCTSRSYSSSSSLLGGRFSLRRGPDGSGGVKIFLESHKRKKPMNTGFVHALELGSILAERKRHVPCFSHLRLKPAGGGLGGWQAPTGPKAPPSFASAKVPLNPRGGRCPSGAPSACGVAPAEGKVIVTGPKGPGSRPV